MTVSMLHLSQEGFSIAAFNAPGARTPQRTEGSGKPSTDAAPSVPSAWGAQFPACRARQVPPSPSPPFLTRCSGRSRSASRNADTAMTARPADGATRPAALARAPCRCGSWSSLAQRQSLAVREGRRYRAGTSRLDLARLGCFHRRHLNLASAPTGDFLVYVHRGRAVSDPPPCVAPQGSPYEAATPSWRLRRPRTTRSPIASAIAARPAAP